MRTASGQHRLASVFDEVSSFTPSEEALSGALREGVSPKGSRRVSGGEGYLSTAWRSEPRKRTILLMQSLFVST